MAGKIVFLATAFSSKKGGINSFNRDLSIALAKILKGKYQVLCVVPYASQSDISSAKKKGVNLIALDPSRLKDIIEDNRAHEIISKVGDENGGEVIWWIGHDVITGSVATKAATLSGLRPDWTERVRK